MADAEVGQSMTADERVEYIYRDLVAVSAYVRRSMLVYNCVSSDYTDTDERTGMQVVRRVLWMTTSHPFFPVIQRLAEHCRVTGQHHPWFVIHRSELADSIPMRGVDSELVSQVAEMIWSQFLADTQRFPVYDEDGTKLTSVPLTTTTATTDVGLKDVNDVVLNLEEEQQPEAILIGADQHAHLYATPSAVPEVDDHPKKE